MYSNCVSPFLALNNEWCRDSLEQMFDKRQRLAYVGVKETSTVSVEQQGLTF